MLTSCLSPTCIKSWRAPCCFYEGGLLRIWDLSATGKVPVCKAVGAFGCFPGCETCHLEAENKTIPSRGKHPAKDFSSAAADLSEILVFLGSSLIHVLSLIFTLSCTRHLTSVYHFCTSYMGHLRCRKWCQLHWSFGCSSVSKPKSEDIQMWVWVWTISDQDV